MFKSQTWREIPRITGTFILIFLIFRYAPPSYL